MQTINARAIEKAVCSTLQTALYPGLTPAVLIVLAEQSAPRPPQATYADVRVAASRQVGQGEGEQLDDDGLTPITGHYEIELRIRTIGVDSRELATDLQFAIANRPDILDLLQQNVGMAYSRETEAVHVPILTDDKWEPRTQFVVTFFAPVTKLIDLGYIASIEDVIMTFDGILNPLTIHSGEINITT